MPSVVSASSYEAAGAGALTVAGRTNVEAATTAVLDQWPVSGHSGGAPAPATHQPPLKGIATWYCCTVRHPGGFYAAASRPLQRMLGPRWRGMTIRVCAKHGPACVRVTLIDTCGCPGQRIVDLYPRAFRKLAPLSRGIVAVTISRPDAAPSSPTRPSSRP